MLVVPAHGLGSCEYYMGLDQIQTSPQILSPPKAGQALMLGGHRQLE